MTFLLDTNAISDLMREDARTLAHLATISATDRVVICTIVRGEILHGLSRLPAGKRKAELEAKASGLLAVIPCEAIAMSAAEHYARIKLIRQKLGLSIDENDLWIAATAMDLNADLVSRDGDVARIPGLRVHDWTI